MLLPTERPTPLIGNKYQIKERKNIYIKEQILKAYYTRVPLNEHVQGRKVYSFLLPL